MGRRPKPLIETVRRKRKRQLLERHLQSINFTATTYIKKVEAKIHRIIITGKTDLSKIEAKIGPLTPNNAYYPSKGETFEVMYEAEWNGIKFHVFTEQAKRYKPKIKIQFTLPENIPTKEHKSLLLDTKELFGNFKLSSIEYAIDIYQPDRLLVDTLFWVMKKYLYIEKKRIPPKIYAKEPTEDISTEELPDNGTTNKTYQISTFDKVYERGDDKDKENEGWNDKSIKWLRLEHTAERDDELLRNELNLFNDLLMDFKFVEIVGNIWNFKMFEKDRNFPLVIDVYSGEDSFQNLFITTRKTRKRPDKYIIDVNDKELLLLKRKIEEAIKASDEEWKAPV